jgi:hypothetical protein
LLSVLMLALGAGRGLADDPPSYTKHVRPFLDRYCVECHRTGKVKGRVNLENYQAIIKSGRKGRMTVVPGKADQSRIVLTCEGKAKPVMPPRKSKQPRAEEVALMRAWVNAGARDDTPAKEEKPPQKTNPLPFDSSFREPISPAILQQKPGEPVSSPQEAPAFSRELS